MKPSRSSPDFLNIVGAPGFVGPWVDRFYETAEIALVLRLAGEPMTAEQIDSALASGIVSTERPVCDLTQRAALSRWFGPTHCHC